MELADIKKLFDTIIPYSQGVALLGFGKEGLSSYKLLRQLYPQMPITIIDKDSSVRLRAELQNDSYLEFKTGDDYLVGINSYPMLLKTPGISLKVEPTLKNNKGLSSQTDIFLRLFGKQCLGVTGTKGKTTTTYLIYHLLKQDFKCVLAGNMGLPFFDILSEIDEDTKVICELSSHQLEYVRAYPSVGVLLNLYQEHLDHYNSYEDYQRAKMNIGRGDFFLFNADEPTVVERVKEEFGEGKDLATKLALYSEATLESENINEIYKLFKNSCVEVVESVFRESDKLYSIENCNSWRGIGRGREYPSEQPSEQPSEYNGKYDTKKEIFDFNKPHPLIGRHNENNLAIALLAGKLFGGDYIKMTERLSSFEPLPHRLQYVGCYEGKYFFNDSISTIPQACIAAIKSVHSLSFVKRVGSLILGGFDRNIDYTPLINFLCLNPIKSIIFVGASGQRIYKMLKKKNALPENVLVENDYAKIVSWAKKNTAEGEACLLSPAAASYDAFKNFEQRGELFCQLVKES